MFRIVEKRELNPTVTFMKVSAPRVAAKAQAGQFIILRVDGDGERIPLTVAGYDRDAGTVDIIFQIVGATTEKLNALGEGDFIHDFVGPLGRPTEIDGLGNVIRYQVIGKEYMDDEEVETMLTGDWDLTLFTCSTTEGVGRVAIRCKRAA